MTETTTGKINVNTAEEGEMGQTKLAAGEKVAMRMWKAEDPTDGKETVSRDYETVGFVISGRAELQLDGQIVALSEGDSWVVPMGAEHTYRIIESFTAVEATSPPAREHGAK